MGGTGIPEETAELRREKKRGEERTGRGGEGRGAAVTGEAAADREVGSGPWTTCSNLRSYASAFCYSLKGKCPSSQDTHTNGHSHLRSRNGP